MDSIHSSGDHPRLLLQQTRAVCLRSPRTARATRNHRRLPAVRHADVAIAAVLSQRGSPITRRTGSGSSRPPGSTTTVTWPGHDDRARAPPSLAVDPRAGRRRRAGTARVAARYRGRAARAVRGVVTRLTSGQSPRARGAEARRTLTRRVRPAHRLDARTARSSPSRTLDRGPRSPGDIRRRSTQAAAGCSCQLPPGMRRGLPAEQVRREGDAAGVEDDAAVVAAGLEHGLAVAVVPHLHGERSPGMHRRREAALHASGTGPDRCRTARAAAPGR